MEGDWMDAVGLGQKGLVGWRERVADGVSRPLASRTPLREDQVRALLGATFFVLSVYYVVDTMRRVTAES
jgi:hypothetical protein